MRDHATAGVLRPTPVVFLAPSPQETPQIPTRALVCPDHLVDPFMTERDPVLGPYPETELLWTPALRPQLASEGATDRGGSG